MVKHLGTKVLETDRLILRKFKIDDAKNMYKNWATDFKTTLYLTWDVHENLELTKQIVKSWVDAYSNLDNYNWVVELKENGEIIGNIGSTDFSEVNSICEIGYCYGSKYWNKGYATEALKRVIKFFFEEVQIHTVTAYHIGENVASGKVMEKAGMHKEAVLKERKYNKNTKLLDSEVIYSIFNK